MAPCTAEVVPIETFGAPRLGYPGPLGRGYYTKDKPQTSSVTRDLFVRTFQRVSKIFGPRFESVLTPKKVIGHRQVSGVHTREVTLSGPELGDQRLFPTGPKRALIASYRKHTGV